MLEHRAPLMGTGRHGELEQPRNECRLAKGREARGRPAGAVLAQKRLERRAERIAPAHRRAQVDEGRAAKARIEPLGRRGARGAERDNHVIVRGPATEQRVGKRVHDEHALAPPGPGRAHGGELDEGVERLERRARAHDVTGLVVEPAVAGVVLKGKERDLAHRRPLERRAEHGSVQDRRGEVAFDRVLVRGWDRPLGPRAFIVEADRAPAGATDADDVTRIVSLATVAWSMEREMYLRDRPIPDLMAAIAPDGVVLASIHPEPLRDAIRAQGATSVLDRMAALPEPARSATHAHALIHLEGSAVRPWSLPGRGCAFGSASAAPAVDRVFVALQDTAGDPRPETARTLLRLMLASGTDD